MRDKYPVGWCPVCRRTVLYSKDPRVKNAIRICIAEEEYEGMTYLCSKCKTMLKVQEIPVMLTFEPRMINKIQSEPSARR